MAEAVARKRRRRKWPWIVLTTILAALVAFVLLVPSILVWLSPFSFSRDLSDVLPPDVAETFSNRTVSVTVRFSHHNEDIQKLYEDYMEKPNSHRAHMLLRGLQRDGIIVDEKAGRA